MSVKGLFDIWRKDICHNALQCNESFAKSRGWATSCKRRTSSPKIPPSSSPEFTTISATSTLYVRAAVGIPLADLCRLLQRHVHLVSAQHVARRDGCLRQVAMGGVRAAHWPLVEHKPGGNKVGVQGSLWLICRWERRHCAKKLSMKQSIIAGDIFVDKCRNVCGTRCDCQHSSRSWDKELNQHARHILVCRANLYEETSAACVCNCRKGCNTFFYVKKSMWSVVQ